MHLYPDVKDCGANKTIWEDKPEYTSHKGKYGSNETSAEGVEDETVEDGGHSE
jgi:hypothetical protein